MLRATFLGTRAELEGAFLDVLPRFYPDAVTMISSACCRRKNARQPLDAYWRRILDPDPAVHSPAARAWHDTEHILSVHVPGRVRLDLGESQFIARPSRHAVHGSALFRP